MKRFNIYEDKQNDRYMIFIFEDDRLCGVNYHHGLGDFESDYMEGNAELLEIYMERFRGKGQTEGAFEVLRASIEEHMMRHSEMQREIVIEHQVGTMMDILTERMCDNLYINPKEITQEQKAIIYRVECDLRRAWKQIALEQTK